MITLDRNDNGKMSSATCSNGNHLAQWRRAYRSISDLFRDLECPDVFRHLARTSHAQSVLGEMRDQWIARGRPELSWPEERAETRSLSAAHKSRLQRFFHRLGPFAGYIRALLKLPYRTGGNTLLLHMTYIV